MRKLACVCAVTLGILIGIAGCGSDAGDRLVMSLMGFTGAGIEQPDVVFDTHVEADVCEFFCFEGEGGNFTFEPYSQTVVNALFLNRGKADILLDSYSVFVPGSGIEEIRRPISAILPGGRCATSTAISCSSGSNCPDGVCVWQEVLVSFLLYNFDFKDRVLLGECPSLVYDDSGLFIIGIANEDDVIPQDLVALLTFSGVDDREERFTVSASLPTSFDNFNRCDAAE